MNEHIISDEVLKSIQRTCYEAGKAAREVYTVRGADGPEIIRCRDCRYFSLKKDDIALHNSPLCKRVRKSEWAVSSNGFCAWAERREA